MSQLSFVSNKRCYSYKVVNLSQLLFIFETQKAKAKKINYLDKFDCSLLMPDGTLEFWHIGSHVVRHENSFTKANRIKRGSSLPLAIQLSNCKFIRQTTTHDVYNFFNVIARESAYQSQPYLLDSTHTVVVIEGTTAYWANCVA
jgi:hypothetical protein